MNKYKSIFLIFVFSILIFSSCLNEYLDMSPESGLTENEVFSKYENAKKFFDFVYADSESASINTAFKLHWSYNTQKFSLEALTDMTDAGRLMQSQVFKGGKMYPSALLLDANQGVKKFGFFNPMWRAIRIANITLEKINQIQNATPQNIDDLKAQAFFVRGFCHFEVFRGWGPMPHITKSLGPDDLWDIPRPSAHTSCMSAVQDMDSAIFYYNKAQKMRRDPGPGEPGHLNNPDQPRPSGMSAMAIKARILLYAASPLNNELGVKDWQNAAKVNWEAIQKALELKYDLLTAQEYKKNFTGAKYSNEQLYGWDAGRNSHTATNLQWLIPCVLRGVTSGNSADCPTQNTVDKYETAWGDPLNTQADRDAATALGHYNEQDPYANRDPRFDFSILYNQSELLGWTNGKAQIYIETVNGVAKYSELLNQNAQGVTVTGYYQKKRWGGENVKNKVVTQYTDPIIRLGELYLNYAEAANEAYGPNTPAVPGAMTAVEAINLIRNRIGMLPVKAEFTTDKDVFRKRIKNERNIELAFEGHYYYDIRRWKDAPEIYSGLLIGMVVEKVDVSPTYPTGFKYTRSPLDSNRQTKWSEAMYYFPYSQGDYLRMTNFVAGDKW